MIELVKVKNKDDGQVKANEILQKIVDPQTLLALSGGSSPDYKIILSDLNPGEVVLVDERHGEEFHADSNELLLKKQGVFEWAKEKGVSHHKILSGKEFKEEAENYDKKIKELFGKFKKRVGVMGVGSNLHTAGFFPFSQSAHSPNYIVAEEVEDRHPKRITMTLKALGEFTGFVILMFGEEKREALGKLLDDEEQDMQKYPAIFFRKAPSKSYLITDIDL